MNPAIETVRAGFPPFVEFDSIPRLFRDMVVTEKLDGTNALVEVREDGEVWAGSRTRYITPEADNYGFARWVREHEEELRLLGAGRHFGEWFGLGIQRGYGLTEKRFALFNVSRWTSQLNTDGAYGQTQCVEVPCCHVVPVLSSTAFDTSTVAMALSELTSDGSWAAPGFMKPEGVVVYHIASRSLFKATLDKNDGHKSAGVTSND